MKIVLIASKQDTAGMNIAKHCEDLGFKVNYIEEKQIFAKNLDDFDADLIIILSKHKSESGKLTLTAHHPGNFSKDTSHGGNSKELSVAYPSYHKEIIRQLHNIKNEVPDFQITTEPTHHGPTSFKTPVIFVEIGSTDKEWKNQKAGESVAKALKTAMEVSPKHPKTAIAIGGGHYSEKFTGILLNSEYAIGHICPKYAIDHLDIEALRQMKERSAEKITFALIDKKGVKSKTKLISMCTELGLKVVQV